MMVSPPTIAAPKRREVPATAFKYRANYAQAYPHLWISKLCFAAAVDLMIERCGLSTYFGYDPVF
jgi:hypothetical protein